MLHTLVPFWAFFWNGLTRRGPFKKRDRREDLEKIRNWNQIQIQFQNQSQFQIQTQPQTPTLILLSQYGITASNRTRAISTSIRAGSRTSRILLPSPSLQRTGSSLTTSPARRAR